MFFALGFQIFYAMSLSLKNLPVSIEIAQGLLLSELNTGHHIQSLSTSRSNQSLSRANTPSPKKLLHKWGEDLHQEIHQSYLSAVIRFCDTF